MIMDRESGNETEGMIMDRESRKETEGKEIIQRE
jgi:hypothetical protein